MDYKRSYFEISNSTSVKTITFKHITLIIFQLGWYLDPLVYGDYPRTMIDGIRNLSSLQGFPASRLPMFTLTEKVEMRGAYDFVAINHYTSSIVKDNSAEILEPSFENDDMLTVTKDPSWEGSAANWLAV